MPRCFLKKFIFSLVAFSFAFGIAQVGWAQQDKKGVAPASKTVNREGYPGLPKLIGLPVCAPDQVHTRVVGRIDRFSLSECPAAPAELRDPQWSSLYFFDLAPEADLAARRSRFAGFSFEASDKLLGQCVYLGCVSVQVSARGKDFKKWDSCIGPFTGGTSVPAEGAPECPAAVRIGGNFGSFLRQEDDGRCCYGWAGPVPPGRPQGDPLQPARR
jgi:hypothetical protein